MPTLEELMADCGLDSPVAGQTKTASANKTATTAEVDQAIANLGMNDAAEVKTAAVKTASVSKDGGSMGLTEIYAGLFNDVVEPAVESTEKVAAAEGTPAEETAMNSFGTAVGEYFNLAVESMLDKVAGELEAEANKGVKPMAHAPGSESALGSPGDPMIGQNHDASSGAALKVTTQSHSPYSLAVKQKLLKRFAGEGIVGEQK